LVHSISLAQIVKECVKENVPKGTEEINLKAFDEGRGLYRVAVGLTMNTSPLCLNLVK